MALKARVDQFVLISSIGAKADSSNFYLGVKGQLEVEIEKLKLKGFAAVRPSFLDGDRAGGFILKELKSVVNIDIELRADDGVEVEELTPQRIDEILRDVAEDLKNGSKPSKEPSTDDKPLAEVASKIYPTLNETLEAVALDGDKNELFKVPISELVTRLSGQSGIKYLVLDGIITQRLLDGAKAAGIEYVVGHRFAKVSKQDGMNLKTFRDLGVA